MRILCGYSDMMAEYIPGLVENDPREILVGHDVVVVHSYSDVGYHMTNIQVALPTFDIVLIDEAAQAHEVTTLIPLQHGAKSVILVGDPKQLPPVLERCPALAADASGSTSSSQPEPAASAPAPAAAPAPETKQ